MRHLHAKNGHGLPQTIVYRLGGRLQRDYLHFFVVGIDRWL